MSVRPRRKVPAREKILETAGALFYREGFRAVGVDTITARSGVAKMSLYRHFPSKDDLIAQYLHGVDDQLMAWMETLTHPHRGDPRAQLEAIFDGVVVLCASPECRGCVFVATAGEFPDQRHKGHVVARAHKERVLRLFAKLASSAGADRPKELAQELLLVMDGAFAAVRVFGRTSHAKSAANAARALIARALQ